ncbi:serine protease [Blastopirellula marina]|uniref:Serine protease n=1 Tax=Blastopirellula marina TaxID=124 RepID=A0A2S8FV57_9BACT|nr:MULTISPECIES: trypsin-like peptidase domain-containing protein [Pirellulaceae]PQO35724.1 serine protease [Blastopirellula marina]RCS53298.1 PDZ domain-containing protein [Bremerella cremea]
MTTLRVFLPTALIAIFLFSSSLNAQERVASAPQDFTPQWNAKQLEFTPEEQRNIYVYEQGNRAVVHITTRSVQIDNFFMMERPAEGSGSGSVLDKQGLILTNYHVIEGAREIRATLFDGESYYAALVGQDPVNDIAVLKIEAPEEVLHPVQFGDSSRLKVGQKVYAIGNPFGLERTMTIGIISSLNRVLPSRSGRTMKSIIQIDAALNRGNSGGPLFDSSGRLIGMNTAIASSTGENTGVGFAIPATAIQRVVPQLVKNGRVIRPDIGITRVYQTEQGLTVATVAAGGPADEAGIRGFRLVREQVQRGPFVYEQTRLDRSEADTIVGIDGHQVQSADDLLSSIENKTPGEEVVLSVIRQGEKVSVPVELGLGD